MAIRMRDLVWRNVLLMLAVHVAGIVGLYTKLFSPHKWQTDVFNLVAAFIGGLGVTAGRHRLWSHRAYEAHSSLQLLLAFAAATVYQQSIFRWCRDHRLHHKYSDTDADPYNARRGFFFSHIGWFFVRKHPLVMAKGSGIDVSDLQQNRIVMFEHRFNKPLALLCTALLPILVPYCTWGERLDVAVFHCCFWRLLLVLHVTWSVNSVAHLFGTRPYDAAIKPVDNEALAFVTLGEGFHNYHHAFPWDYKAGELGGDARNLTTLVIDAFAILGLVTQRKTAKKELVEKRAARTGDASRSSHLHSIRHLRNSFILLAAFYLVV